jgi:hypothetical protein
MNKLWIIFVSLFANSFWCYGHSAPADLQKLLERCERQESISTIRVKYTFSVSGPNVGKIEESDLLLTGKQSAFLAAKKPFDKTFLLIQAQRLEDSRKKPFQFTIWKAYHNRIYREIQVSDQTNIPSGLIAQELPPDMDMNLTPLGFTVFHRCLGGKGQTLLDILRTSDPNFVLSLAPVPVKVNGCDSVKLTCSRQWISNKWIKLMDIYFSLEHDDSIVRISYYNADQITLEYNVRKFRSIGDGLWFPTECEFRSSNADINTISVTEVDVNSILDEKEFELEFPPGTRVKDAITGKHYTVKPTGNRSIRCWSIH